MLPFSRSSRRRIFCSALLALTILIGLAVRLLLLGLPWFLYKYLGSALWAVALYLFLAILRPRLRPPVVATMAIVIAMLLELSRLVPIASVDAFRLTFAGKMLLGRYFSTKNIAAYTFAIALAAVFDLLITHCRQIGDKTRHTRSPNLSTRDTL
jgi:Protein of unknown function (DUF2809)